MKDKSKGAVRTPPPAIADEVDAAETAVATVEAPVVATTVNPVIEEVFQRCSTCVAWRVEINRALPIFGGCARSGQTTTHYGDNRYNHYTTDQSICSAWELRGTKA